MKKIAILSLSFFALVSCTKDFTCTCTTTNTNTQGSQSQSSTSTSTRTLKGLTKAQAVNECHSMEMTQTDPSKPNDSYKTVQDCEVK